MRRTSVLQPCNSNIHIRTSPSFLPCYYSTGHDSTRLSQIIFQVKADYHTLPYITIHCHTLPYIAIHCRILPYIVVHYYTLSYIAIHYHILPYIAIYYRTLLYILGLHMSSLL